jgi:hypothetical protein
MHRLTTLTLVLLLASCAETTRTPPDQTPLVSDLEILGVSASNPAIAGTVLRVTARGAQGSGTRTLVLSLGGTQVSLDEIETETDVLGFPLSAQAIADLGTGEHDLEAVLHYGSDSSPWFAILLNVTTELDIVVTEVPGGRVFRNDEIILRGSGFISPGEGSLEAEVRGTFLPDFGSEVSVDETMTVLPAEQDSRERGLLRLSTAIGGMESGEFTGTVRLRSTLLSGSESASEPRSVNWTFQAPALFGVEGYSPGESLAVSVGQILTIRGGGFLGSPDEPSAASLLRIEGTLTPRGGSAEPFGPEEVVLIYVSSSVAEFGIEWAVGADGLVSDLFGVARGHFAGTVTLIVLTGTDEVVADSVPIELDLEGVRQVCVVHFLPGFYDSLRHFGLASAATQVESAAIDRMSSIYSGYAVEFHRTAPNDFLENAISTLEIGGPDPNGLGLLGYDNTPGKDVGNLRLFDQIGGANAETQDDGYSGYGGVFIESFLWWSEAPGLSGSRPPGAPPPDPLFDDIFGPVRGGSPATLAEAQGTGDTGRLAQVDRAIAALGSMVGETASHELGHSLGMADPYGSVDVFHNQIPGDGCLMDSGSGRPLGERAAQLGYDETRFCYDEPEYMQEILGL